MEPRVRPLGIRRPIPPMKEASHLLWVVMAGALLTQGCSKQAWYEGLKNRQQQECMQLPSNSEVQRCLENLPGNYEQYRQDREGGGR